MGNRYQKATVILLLLAGFLAGTALPEFLRMGTGSYAGFLSLYGLQKYKERAVSAVNVLPYIAAGRLRTLLFLWMSSYTAAGLLFHLVYAWWLAASAGMLLSVFMLRNGYEGILLFFCCLFPQWLLYGAMWQREIGFLLTQWRRGSFTPVDGRGRISAYRKDLADLAGMVGLCLLGCSAEAFLGNWTLRIFLQYFA